MKKLFIPGDHQPSFPKQEYESLEGVIAETLERLADLDHPKHTPFDQGRYVGKLGRVLAPGYTIVHEAQSLGAVNPPKPFVHIPERTNGYQFGWFIPEANAIVTENVTAFMGPLAVSDKLRVVTGPQLPYETWQAHGLEAQVVSDWLQNLCEQTTAARV